MADWTFVQILERQYGAEHILEAYRSAPGRA
jgi:hypothetical protein